MNKHRFSLIIPVYNTNKEFLVECFKSIENIDYTDFQVIIIDDGSNEQTKQIINEYATKNSEWLLISQNNQGQYMSRINGLKKANGEYVFFFDSDDLLDSQTFNILNEIIDKNDIDVLMYELPRFSNSINELFDTPHYFTEGFVEKDKVIAQIANFHICNICSKCAKRELLLKSSQDNNYKYGEDLIQATELVLNANSFYYTENLFYYYRKNEETRNYYSFQNTDYINYLIPVYDLLFKNNSNYNNLLPSYKTAAINAVIYASFVICKLNNYSDSKKILDSLNNQPLVKLLETIDANASIISEILFKLFNHKYYRLMHLASNLYGVIFGFDKATFR